MIKTSCFSLLETELALKLDSAFKGRTSLHSQLRRTSPLERQTLIYVEGSYFGWVYCPRIYNIRYKLVSRVYFLDILFFRFSENIYEMHACSFIEKEEQWKFVDQIFVVRHVLATRPLLPRATAIVFVVLKKSQHQQPNVWHMSQWHYLLPRMKVLQRSSSSSRLLLRAASSRTWIYKQLRQIIVFLYLTIK